MGWQLVVDCRDEAGDQVFVEIHAGDDTIKFIHDLCTFAAEGSYATAR